MTPRQVDVAFVLESVEGVRALYGIIPGREVAKHFDLAVEIEDSGRVLAAVHYALLRVLTHDECARVFLFHTSAPSVIAESAQLLHLQTSDRDAARRRVPPPPPRPPLPAAPFDPFPSSAMPTMLVVGDGDNVAAVLHDVVDVDWSLARSAADGARLARERTYDLFLCDARFAFGQEGLLAQLPLDVARRVLVLASVSELPSARWRLQGTERILAKPLEAWLLHERIQRMRAMPYFPAPNRARITAVASAGRRIEEPPANAPFTVLLVDLDDDVHDALRSIFREEARHLMRRDPEEAAEVALAKPFHLVVCSAKAALHPRSFLDAVAREDPAGADRVIVVAPSRDVRYVDHGLAEKGRKNVVLALPIDEALLRREVFRDHPSLVARVAIADVAAATPAPVARARYRRLAALVVDDDSTTEILFAAASPQDDADVSLATTAMDAFEHVVSRAVDLLIVSATMRGDGGEPFYRVLWRLQPELKTRTVLVAAHDAIPSSLPPSHPPRVLERPLTSAAITSVLRAFGSSSH